MLRAPARTRTHAVILCKHDNDCTSLDTDSGNKNFVCVCLYNGGWPVDTIWHILRAGAGPVAAHKLPAQLVTDLHRHADDDS